MSQAENVNGVQVEPDEPRAGTSEELEALGERLIPDDRLNRPLPKVNPHRWDDGPVFDVRTDGGGGGGGGEDLGDHLRTQVEDAGDSRLRWVPAPECTRVVHAYGEDSWRPGGVGEPHEHLVILDDETEKTTNPHEDTQVALAQARERVIAAAVRWVNTPSYTPENEEADAALCDAVEAYERAAHLRVGLSPPSAARSWSEAEKTEAARALRDLLHQADMWAHVVCQTPDPDDEPLIAAIRRVRQAKAKVMPSWMFVENTPDAASAAGREQSPLTELTQRLRNEVARAARRVDACVDADDRTAANEAVAQVDRTHNELNAAIWTLERRYEAARAKLAASGVSTHTSEAAWRSRIASEVYAYAERLEREPENRSLGVALAAIVRQVGDEVGKMPRESS